MKTSLRTCLSLMVLVGGVASAKPERSSTPVQKESPPPLGTPHPFNLPERRAFTLENGLEVRLVPYGTMPKTLVRFVVDAGNASEGPDETWLADVTADLMQEGTSTRSAAQLAQEAAQMGGQLQASVSPDGATFEAEVLSDFAPAAVELVADVLKNPTFPATELERIRRDRLRELALQKAEPGSIASERFNALLYPAQAYGRTFPTEAMLQGYTVDKVRKFYDGHYGTRRTKLYVVGKFDAEKVEAALRKAMADFRQGPAPESVAAAPKTERAVHLVDRPGAAQSTLMIGLPVVYPGHPDYVKLQVMNTVLGGYFSSRMTANLREKHGYTYSPFSELGVHPKTGLWIQHADVTTSVTGASLKEIFSEIDQLQAKPPSAQEVDAAKQYRAGQFVLVNSSRGGIASLLNYLDLHALPEDYLSSYVQRTLAVTPADVQEMARKYLKDQTMTIVVVGDRKQVEAQVKPFGKLVVDPS